MAFDASHPFVVGERARWVAAMAGGLLDVAETPDGALIGFAARRLRGWRADSISSRCGGRGCGAASARRLCAAQSRGPPPTRAAALADDVGARAVGRAVYVAMASSRTRGRVRPSCERSCAPARGLPDPDRRIAMVHPGGGVTPREARAPDLDDLRGVPGAVQGHEVGPSLMSSSPRSGGAGRAPGLRGPRPRRRRSLCARASMNAASGAGLAHVPLGTSIRPRSSLLAARDHRVETGETGRAARLRGTRGGLLGKLGGDEVEDRSSAERRWVLDEPGRSSQPSMGLKWVSASARVVGGVDEATGACVENSPRPARCSLGTRRRARRRPRPPRATAGPRGAPRR